MLKHHPLGGSVPPDISTPSVKIAYLIVCRVLSFLGFVGTCSYV